MGKFTKTKGTNVDLTAFRAFSCEHFKKTTIKFKRALF